MGPLIRTIDLIVVGRDRVVAHPPRDLIRTVDSDCAAERERERVDHDPGTADLGSDDQERMRVLDRAADISPYLFGSGVL